jgi:hypothetical protein
MLGKEFQINCFRRFLCLRNFEHEMDNVKNSKAKKDDENSIKKQLILSSRLLLPSLLRWPNVILLIGNECLFQQVPTSRPSQVNLSPYPAGQEPSSMRRVDSAISQFSERPEDGDGEVKETWWVLIITLAFSSELSNVVTIHHMWRQEI